MLPTDCPPAPASHDSVMAAIGVDIERWAIISGGRIWGRCIESAAAMPESTATSRRRVQAWTSIMQLCADHGMREHNMKGFGPELYVKMRSCVQILEEGTPGSKEEAPRGE